MPACFCSVCKANNPYDGCLVSNSTRFRHEAEDQNRMKEAAERSSVAAVVSELPTTNHDDIAYELSNDDQEDDAFASDTYANQEDFNGEISQDDDIDDREDPDDANDIDPEARFHNNSAFPTEPAAFLMFIMVILLYSKHFCTNEGLELIMLILNQVLAITNHHYRFPARVHTLEKWAQLNERVYHGIQSYVCCSVCRSMYPVQLQRTRQKKCNWKDSVRNATICGNNLYVEKNGIFLPLQLFHYNSIQSTIETYLRRPHFVDQLLNRRKSYFGYCSDIQDAHAFNAFKSDPADSTPFTASSPYNVLISIFLDWFQLYDNNAQDVGGIYASIQNLWPSERHLQHNTLTLGIINGPAETSYLHINHYLDLIVNELQVLKQGVMMRTCYNEDVLVKICANHYQGDLPAIRKMLGLSAHNADLGCSSCANPFPKAVVIRNGKQKKVNVYSNTNASDWTPRTLSNHRKGVELYLDQDNITQRDEIKKQHGALYSSFLQLSYFNPITDGGIDVMHLILNGISKRIVQNIWLGIGSTVDCHVPLLNNLDLKQISAIYGRIIVPLNYENSMQRKISMGDGFSGLKSSEWLIFVFLSPLVLLRFVTGKHYENWLTFVAIARIVCSTCITDVDIDTVRNLCIKFMDEFKSVYVDPRYMSINFHMLLHLADQNLKAFGSGPSSWNFAYESRNKSMKAINTNGRSNLERTLLERHLIDAHLEDYLNTLPRDTFTDTAAAATSGVDILFCFRKRDNENVSQMANYTQDEYLASVERFDLKQFLSQRCQFLIKGYEHLPPSAVKSLKFKKELPLPVDDFGLLLDYYTMQYGNAQYTLGTSLGSMTQDLLHNGYLKAENKVLKFVSFSLFHSKYKSCESNVKHHRGSHVLAFSKSQNCLAPAQIRYFFRHLAPVFDQAYNVQMVYHTFAVVNWYKPALNPLPSFEKAAEFIDLCSNEFYPKSVDCILPVLNIFSPIAILPDYIDNMNAFVKMPEQLIF